MLLQPKVCLWAITLGNLSPNEHHNVEQHVRGTGAHLPPQGAQDRLDNVTEQLRAATASASHEFRRIHSTKLYHALSRQVCELDDGPRLVDAAEKKAKVFALPRG